MIKNTKMLANLSSGVLQEQAAAYLASGSYRLTQEIYKILLKREDNLRYRQGLAQCYLQRALDAAKRGKYKEAITLWENHLEYVQQHLDNHRYIGWLLKTGQKAKINTYLQTLDLENLIRDYPQLACYLGFFHVLGQIDLLALLPGHIPLYQQTQQAQLALQAWQNNDRDSMYRCLAAIPLRSALHDFCALLKAADQFIGNRDKADKLLSSIKSDSPYHAASGLLSILSMDGKTLIQALLALPNTQQKLLGKMRGLTDRQIKLLQYLGRQKSPLATKMQFELAIQYQGLIGADYAQRFCLALLPSYPAGLRLYEKNFGALSRFEKLRNAALRAESRREPLEAINYWDQCIDVLLVDKQKNALKVAFILRHIAEMTPPHEALDYLLESLEFDRQDKATHLKVLDIYQNTDQKEAYKRYLQEVLAIFPDDVDVLDLAMREAVSRRVFKKAVQYAKKILTLDPVNSRAKQVLFSSHLNHARKLLQGQKYHRVEKEIRQAESLGLGKHYSELAGLLSGFFVYLGEDKKRGMQMLTENLRNASEGQFIRRYRIVHEALTLDLPTAPILRGIKALAEDYVLSDAELNRFLRLLDEQRKTSDPCLIQAVEKVKKEFKRFLKEQTWTDAQRLQVMQSMENIRHFELMRHCLRCVPDTMSKPIWIFYKVYLAAQGNPAKVSLIDVSKLQVQYDAAKQQGDERTAARISGFLDKIYQYRTTDNFASPAEEGYFDPYDHLFETIDSRTFTKINRKYEQMQKNLPAERMIDLLLAALPDKKWLRNILMDEDLFSALVFLQAARELDIDIGVSVDDILNVARENEPPASFPFFNR